MKKKLLLLLLVPALLSGCGRKVTDSQILPMPTVEVTPAPSEEAEPADPPRSAYLFSFLVQDADGTTTQVLKDAYTLHYNADWFQLIPAESNDYMAALVGNHMGVEHVTVRIVRPDTVTGFSTDCYDYFNLEELDDAQPDELQKLSTDVGEVTYYLSFANLDGNGWNCEVYYAINVGKIAFCGKMDVADDAAGILVDETAARGYMTELFENGTAKMIFENLFLEVTENGTAQGA